MSKQNLIESLKGFNSEYGVVISYGWKLILYPLVFLFLYFGRTYLDTNYVSKEYFDSAMSQSSVEKRQSAEEQKLQLKEIGGKLDALLLSSAANGQRFVDSERRISRLEDKVDKIK